MSLLDSVLPEPEVVPGLRLEARLAGCLLGDLEGFRTRPVAALDLDHEGIAGDAHRGFTRAAGAREPWYPRGTVIRSGRQVSIVSEEELAEVARRLDLAAVDPALIGANMVVAGVPRFSFLPAGTRLVIGAGATLVVEQMNGPCRHAGRSLAGEHPGRDDLELGFVTAARHRRGVVASVERPGRVAAGDKVQVRVPEQWIWAG